MEAFSELFGFAIGVTSRTFFWVLLGVLAFRTGKLSAALVQRTAGLVFRYGLPIILFFGAARVDYGQVAQAKYLLAGVIATLLVVAAAILYARLRGYLAGDLAIFAQAAYRANTGVVGIALAAAAYGEEGVALAAMPVALLTILYNLIAVVLLGRVYAGGRSPLWWPLDILRNPLVIGIAAGAAWSILDLPMGPRMQQFGSGVSSLVLPLALGCIGASLNLKVLASSGLLTLEASLWKLVVTPAVAVAIGVAMGVHSAELGVLFLLTASPVASASYVMIVAAGGDGSKAANVVVASTLLSLVSLTLGLAVLQALGWI